MTTPSGTISASDINNELMLVIQNRKMVGWWLVYRQHKLANGNLSIQSPTNVAFVITRFRQWYTNLKVQYHLCNMRNKKLSFGVAYYSFRLKIVRIVMVI